MANRRERDLFNGEGVDPMDPVDAEDFDDSSSVDGGSGASHASPGEVGGSRSEAGLTERLTDVLVEDGDGDLLIQQTNREDRLLLWLQALDMQVVGACRADERLKPLLKMNTASGVAEDPLLAQLTQHFEPSEVDRLFTLSSKLQCSAVVVDGIPTDSSGRSFFIRSPDSRTFFYWCSEKSKLLGIELLEKIKDLLKRKPSIAELSGISKSRLDCFATQLRAFLVGSSGSSSHDGSVCASTSANSTGCCNNVAFENSQTSSKFPRSRHIGGQTTKGDTMLYQSILSPRSSSFKEVPPRNSSSHRIAAREKIKRRGDSYQPAVDNLTNDSAYMLNLSSASDLDKSSEVAKSLAFSSGFLGSLENLTAPSSLGSGGEFRPLVSPLFSPYYCWCPPEISTFPSISALPQSSHSSVESLPLPSGNSLLPSTLSRLLEPVQPLNLSTSMDFPEFPPFLPDPLVRISLPTSQQIPTFTQLMCDPLVRMSLPTSQQIPTFTPLMCDPIVHVPVIDVCSSGQGYLVSAGPAMSTSIPPLHPTRVNPLIPESDAVVKGARETLRLLLSGSSQGVVGMDPLPAILTNPNENRNVLVTGSRGLYSGTRDINVIANSIAAMGFVSQISNGDSEGDSEVCGGNYGILGTLMKPNDSGGTFTDDEGGSSFNSKYQ